MIINEFVQEVHQNAVAHGWWDEERSVAEIFALIHSEWSEALEEARAGKPMAYQVQSYGIVQGRIQTDVSKWFPGQKPEGIGIELLDGCIRIFDYLGKRGVTLKYWDSLEDLIRDTPKTAYKIPLPQLIANLHEKTSISYALLRPADNEDKAIEKRGFVALLEIVAIACSWIREQGADVETLMMKKHEYNKLRPYKHGKKF